MNNKIVFIYGDEKLEKGIIEGKIEGVGDINDDYFHATTLINFAKEKYPEVKAFNSLNNRHRPETVSYFYTAFFNHIVFLNISSVRNNVLQKRGVFLMPNDITERQKQSLYEFSDEISDYEVGIYYDLELKDGVLDEKGISSTSNETPRQLIDRLFNIKNKKINK